MQKSKFEFPGRQLSFSDLRAPKPSNSIERPNRTRQKVGGIKVDSKAANLINNAEKHKGISVDLKERREKLLEILTALGSVSSRTALDKVVHTEGLVGVKEKIADRYETDELEEKIAPGAKYRRRYYVRDVEQMLDAVTGDVDGAYASAWSEFTSEQRAHFIVDTPELYPDREEISIAFRGEFGTKDGSGSRDDLRSQLAGKITRRHPINVRLPLPEDPGNRLAA